MHAGGLVAGQERRLATQLTQTLHGWARLRAKDLIEHEAGHGLRHQRPGVVDGGHPDARIAVLGPPTGLGGRCRQDPAQQAQSPHTALRVGCLYALAGLLPHVDPGGGRPASGVLRGLDEGA